VLFCLKCAEDTKGFAKVRIDGKDEIAKKMGQSDEPTVSNNLFTNSKRLAVFVNLSSTQQECKGSTHDQSNVTHSSNHSRVAFHAGAYDRMKTSARLGKCQSTERLVLSSGYQQECSAQRDYLPAPRSGPNTTLPFRSVTSAFTWPVGESKPRVILQRVRPSLYESSVQQQQQQQQQSLHGSFASAAHIHHFDEIDSRYHISSQRHFPEKSSNCSSPDCPSLDDAFFSSYSGNCCTPERVHYPAPSAAPARKQWAYQQHESSVPSPTSVVYYTHQSRGNLIYDFGQW
jgi:hypothetical protein